MQQKAREAWKSDWDGSAVIHSCRSTGEPSWEVFVSKVFHCVGFNSFFPGHTEEAVGKSQEERHEKN